MNEYEIYSILSEGLKYYKSTYTKSEELLAHDALRVVSEYVADRYSVDLTKKEPAI